MVDPFYGGYSNPTILTSLASFYARDIGTATDANYGYYSAVNAATNKWAFYGAGTAESYFGGGISAPTFNGYVPLKMSGTPMIGDIATAYSTNGTSGVWSGPVVTTNLVAYISSYCCDAFGNIVRPTDTNAAFAAYQIALQGGYTSPESNPVAGTNSAWSIQLGADGNRGGAWDATESTGYFDVNAASVRTFFANYASTNALPKKNPLFMFIGNHGNGHPVPLGEPIFGINNDFSDNPIFSVIAELVWPAGQGRIGINTNNPAAVLHVSGYSTTVDYQHWTDADGTLAASVTSNKVVRAAGGFSSLGVGTVTTSATGATNTLTANIVLYVTAATGASLTDNAGTTEFSGVTIAAFTPVRLQPGGKFVGTAISYATGTASHAW
jgi:hypothetical protein